MGQSGIRCPGKCPHTDFRRIAWSVVMLLGVSPGDVSGAVSFFGSVSPDPPGDGNVESALTVGLAGDDNPSLTGFVQIDGGTSIEYDTLIIGDDAGYQGEVVITGSLSPGGQSALVLEEGGSSATPTAQIGHEGVGTLKIENGGQLLFENTAADLSIGVEAAGVGTLLVSGTLSRVTVPDSIRIGDEGYGVMRVLDGGFVHNSDLTNTVIIGADTGAVGEVLVEGAGSIWQIDDDLTVGSLGTGTLVIGQGGLVDVDRPGANTTVGVNGRLELNGGTLAAVTVTMNGYMGGTGDVFGAVNSLPGSTIQAAEGAQLRIVGDMTHAGRADANGGELLIVGSVTNNTGGEVFANGGVIHFKGPVSNNGDVAVINGRVTSDTTFNNNSSGRVQGRDALLEFDGGLNNAGALQLSSGTSDIFGNITNTGGIVVSGNSTATFYDDITNSAVISVAAGSTAVFFGDLTGNGVAGTGMVQLEGDTAPGASPGVMVFGGDVSLGFLHRLDIELGGLLPGTGHDVMDVAGHALIGGTLNVSFINAFTPNAGDSFDILDWGSISGIFSSINLPTLGGDLDWDTSNLLIDGTLSVVSAALAGDLNSDGFVGIDDLNIVLGNWNQNVPPGNPLADPSGDGFVGIDDLNTVLGNWNAGTPPTTQANIPEPGVALILATGVLGLACRRR